MDRDRIAADMSTGNYVIFTLTPIKGSSKEAQKVVHCSLLGSCVVFSYFLFPYLNKSKLENSDNYPDLNFKNLITHTCA